MYLSSVCANRDILYVHTHLRINIKYEHMCRYDSDRLLAEGDVGMAGVAVDSVEDMKVIVVIP